MTKIFGFSIFLSFFIIRIRFNARSILVSCSLVFWKKNNYLKGIIVYLIHDFGIIKNLSKY